jgi:Tfp pilus assembly protein PilV
MVVTPGKFQGGVALLEVMVALVLISLGVTASLKAIGLCTRSESLATKQMVAMELAAHQLAVLRSRGASAGAGEQRGKFDAPYESYSWQATVDAPAGDLPFRLVRLSVFSEASPRQALLITQGLL